MEKTYLLQGPQGPYQSSEPGLVGGYRPKKIFGKLDCVSANRAIAKGGYVKHRVFFADEDQAKSCGYRPCAKCMPAAYLDWKQAQSEKTEAKPVNETTETFLFHATARKHLESILSDGLRGPNYWATGFIGKYYMETVEDEEEEPVLLRMPLDLLARHAPEPDHPALQEPLTHTLGMSEEEVNEEWEKTQGRWEDSLDLIGSLRCRQPISAELLLQYNPELAGVDKKPSAKRPGPR